MHMNYLAHLFLSQYTPGFLIGGLLGDFVKGGIKDTYIGDIKKGIDLHFKIDVYTDNHQIFRLSKSVINPKRRRFAGVMIDMFYDHFLAKNWSKYSDAQLVNFSQNVYNILQNHQHLLPESLKIILPNMIAHDLLTSYKEVEGIAHALKRISARLKRENDIKYGIEDLLSNYELLELHFFEFFDDLITYTSNLNYQLDLTEDKGL